MAGKKYGIVMAAKVPGSYHQMSKEDQEIPGKVMEQLMPKYAGKVDFLRRIWTSAFSAEVTDVFYIECDDLADFHAFSQEMDDIMASKGKNPESFGSTVSVWVGINPDAE